MGITSLKKKYFLGAVSIVLTVMDRTIQHCTPKMVKPITYLQDTTLVKRRQMISPNE